MKTTLLSVCLIFCGIGQDASAQDFGEVRFDPVPVELSEAVAGPGRNVTTRDLLSLRESYGLSISPDGEWVAFIVGQANYETNSYRSGLFVVRTSGKEPPRCLGTAGAPHWTAINEWDTEKPVWSEDGQRIFFRAKMKESDLWQVWQWDVPSGNPVPVSNAPGNVVRYEFDGDRRKLMMSVESAESEQDKKNLVESGILFDGKIRPWEGIGPILASLGKSRQTKETWIHEFDSGAERAATVEEKKSFDPDLKEIQSLIDSRGNAAAKCQVRSAVFAPDRGSVAVSCTVEDDDPSGLIRRRLVLASIDGKRQTEVAPDSTLISDYWWSSDSKKLYFASSQGDGRPRKMRVMDLGSGSVREFYQPAEVLGDFSMNAAGTLIACTRESSASPVRIAVIDLSNNTIRSLADLNPEFGNINLTPAERISGVNRYGEEWFGHLVKPAGYEKGKRYPLIVTLYRSGDYFLLGATGNEYPIHAFAANGFAVLSFDIGRHRLRKRGDFEDYLIDWLSPTASLEMAVKQLSDAGLVDPERVGLAGLSHGAEVVEFTISHSKAFRTAIESGPAARDPYFYYMAGGTWHELFAKWGLAGWPEGKSKENWPRLAASLNADRIDAALLVNTADSELIASMSLYTSLEQLHKPVELYIYPGELHIKNQPRHRYEIFERNIDWFRFWLKGEKDSAPGKQEQYSRWEKLRSLSSPD